MAERKTNRGKQNTIRLLPELIFRVQFILCVPLFSASVSLILILSSFIKKWPNPGHFLFIFGLFNNTIFTTNQCEKMFKYPSSIQRWDSNAQSFEHESSLITTRPGLPPPNSLFYCCPFVLLFLPHLIGYSFFFCTQSF